LKGRSGTSRARKDALSGRNADMNPAKPGRGQGTGGARDDHRGRILKSGNNATRADSKLSLIGQGECSCGDREKRGTGKSEEESDIYENGRGKTTRGKKKVG